MMPVSIPSVFQEVANAVIAALAVWLLAKALSTTPASPQSTATAASPNQARASCASQRANSRRIAISALSVALSYMALGAMLSMPPSTWPWWRHFLSGVTMAWFVGSVAYPVALVAGMHLRIDEMRDEIAEQQRQKTEQMEKRLRVLEERLR